MFMHVVMYSGIDAWIGTLVPESRGMNRLQKMCTVQVETVCDLKFQELEENVQVYNRQPEVMVRTGVFLQ